jgi:hypothetical protein
MEDNKFNFQAFVKQAGEQLRAGKSLSGPDGVFTPTIEKDH